MSNLLEMLIEEQELRGCLPSHLVLAACEGLPQERCSTYNVFHVALAPQPYHVLITYDLGISRLLPKKRRKSIECN
jgi:hypothetical protein